MNLVPNRLREWSQAHRERTAELGRRLRDKYARLFWALHSAWALITGIGVLVLAHNRYGFLRWVVLFIALTWGSTLFFARFAAPESSRAMRFAQGVVSYLTRVMYQETLFFLIPFYFYSATFPSWNFLYLLLLAGLAVLSCFDLLFDRFLRESKPFALAFFAFVSFSALQFFLPLLLRVRVDYAAYLAAGVAFIAAGALAHTWTDLRLRWRLVLLAVGLVAALAVVRLIRPVLPPVPLRMTRLTYAGAVDRHTLKTPGDFRGTIPIEQLRTGRLCAVATIFSPEAIPARIQIRFLDRDGKVLRESRTPNLNATPRGFRVWDCLPGGKKGFAPVSYRAEVWTGEGQLLGRGDIRIVSEAAAQAPAPLTP
ncbi:MAG TPA: DUF5924 family protein [Thermoanaerobaculia bacterium]|nr:DUF5924 family protein [Thermoanaerobaculia bacterium]